MRGKLLLALVAAAFLALGLVNPAGAVDVPALRTIPASIAATRPDLVERRILLVSAREALNQRRASHNAKCKLVEVGSAQYADCLRTLDAIAHDLDVHIQQSQIFNREVAVVLASCQKNAGEQLRFALTDCERDQSATISWDLTKHQCILYGDQVPEKSLACVAAAKDPFAALAACGFLVTTVPP
jgi:hypothetical protein